MTTVIWTCLLLSVLALLLTWGMRTYAINKNIIDVPNARSSHSIPTPRGGGVAIICSFLFGITILVFLNKIELSLFLAIFFPGLLAALIGFLDDHGHVPARWRLLAHISSAVIALWFLHGVPSLDVFGVVVQSGWVLNGLGILYLVWLLNLYNFMDGIDGLASVEAMSVSFGMVTVLLIGNVSSVSIPYACLGAAVAGFLFWNFPPAKIFMGDAGSGFLGLIIGVLSLTAAWVAPEYFWASIILLGAFLVDATLTLIRRLCRGVKVYEAHRTHAYQYASRVYGHKKVTLAVFLINCFWLFPIALLASLKVFDAALLTVVALIPLIIVCVKFKAGTEEKN